MLRLTRLIYLSNKTGISLDRDAILTDHKQRSLDRIHQLPAQPGIPETLLRARQLGLKLGVASSSPAHWVHPLLKHLGLFEFFDVILCKDHVTKIKPDPELFLRCAEELGLARSEAMSSKILPMGFAPRMPPASSAWQLPIPSLAS